MEICKDGHKEICFDDGWYCPVCELREELNDALAEIEKLKAQTEK